MNGLLVRLASLSGHHFGTVALAVPFAVVAVAMLPAAPASASSVPAHPLGNFSINQYLGFTLRPDRIDVTAVVDFAEIPTLQGRARVDSDADNAASAEERAAYATAACHDVAGGVDAHVDDDRLDWTVSRSEFTYAMGIGGLEVSRLGCALIAPARLDRPSAFRVENRFLADRIGWREMTAAGRGVRLVESSLPVRSVSEELRAYPDDLLSSALNVRSAVLRVEPGTGGGDSSSAMIRSGSDPLSRWMAVVDRRFQELAGGSRLTPTVGVLAVLLALLLGAGHAALPGHGKTVLAAYLAGERGRPRDALTVAGTVTLTHTGGVLALGLLLTAGTALTGEAILGYLGLASGAIVLGVGAGMLHGALRRRRRRHGHPAYAPGHGHAHDDHHGRGHGHEHAHDDHHGRGHGHGHAHDDDHGRGHGHGHAEGHEHDQHQVRAYRAHHDHGHEHDHDRPGRLGLAGIGLAGGLVPSPSALMVLLAAIGLGRTGFGVLLVVAYGMGMAATLTGAGLLLLAVQRRMRRTGTGRFAARMSSLTTRLNGATPAATAALVMLVGMGLAARAAVGVF
jgi:nickel/cobalt exporter